MSFLDQIGVLVLTYNEAPNIGRTLDALRAFPEIVVLDSGSTDATSEIVAGFTNARLVTRPFDEHAVQWNYGVTQCGLIRPWVLALDADYVLPTALVEEMSRLTPADQTSAFRASFRYCINGRPLSGALYTPVAVLFRRDRARYVQSGHTQRLVVDGAIAELKGRINHDDRKPLSRWLRSQQRYARLEAQHLLSIPHGHLRLTDRVRRTGWAAPIFVFFYTLLWKRCLLDGWSGWLYVLQRTLAETMITLEIADQRLKNEGNTSRGSDTPIVPTAGPAGVEDTYVQRSAGAGDAIPGLSAALVGRVPSRAHSGGAGDLAQTSIERVGRVAHSQSGGVLEDYGPNI
jgi:glycosyltransferase involved in cell wall biosynthesis